LDAPSLRRWLILGPHQGRFKQKAETVRCVHELVITHCRNLASMETYWVREPSKLPCNGGAAAAFE